MTEQTINGCVIRVRFSVHYLTILKTRDRRRAPLLLHFPLYLFFRCVLSIDVAMTTLWVLWEHYFVISKKRIQWTSASLSNKKPYKMPLKCFRIHDFKVEFLPSGVLFGIRYDISFWTWSRCFSNPEERIGTGAIVCKWFDKYCWFIDSIHVTLETVEEFYWFERKRNLAQRKYSWNAMLHFSIKMNRILTLIPCANCVRGPINRP